MSSLSLFLPPLALYADIFDRHDLLPEGREGRGQGGQARHVRPGAEDQQRSLPRPAGFQLMLKLED